MSSPTRAHLESLEVAADRKTSALSPTVHHLNDEVDGSGMADMDRDAALQLDPVLSRSKGDARR